MDAITIPAINRYYQLPTLSTDAQSTNMQHYRGSATVGLQHKHYFDDDVIVI